MRQLISQKSVDAVFETMSLPDHRFVFIMLNSTEVFLNTGNMMVTVLRKRL